MTSEAFFIYFRFFVVENNLRTRKSQNNFSKYPLVLSLLSLTHTQIFSLYLSHTLLSFISVILSLTHTLLSISLFLSQTNTHFSPSFQSFFFLFLTQTFKCLSFSLSLSLSLSLSVCSLSFSLTLSHTHYSLSLTNRHRETHIHTHLFVCGVSKVI